LVIYPKPLYRRLDGVPEIWCVTFQYNTTEKFNVSESMHPCIVLINILSAALSCTKLASFLHESAADRLQHRKPELYVQLKRTPDDERLRSKHVECMYTYIYI
jgi:hypothetical protein